MHFFQLCLPFDYAQGDNPREDWFTAQPPYEGYLNQFP